MKDDDGIGRLRHKAKLLGISGADNLSADDLVKSKKIGLEMNISGYNLDELKTLAKKLGLKTSMNKRELLDSVEVALLPTVPNVIRDFVGRTIDKITWDYDEITIRFVDFDYCITLCSGGSCCDYSFFYMLDRNLKELGGKKLRGFETETEIYDTYIISDKFIDDVVKYDESSEYNDRNRNDSMRIFQFVINHSVMYRISMSNGWYSGSMDWYIEKNIDE